MSLVIALLAQVALPVTLPTVAVTAADATCGGREPLARIATCMSTTQSGLETVMAAYEADFGRQGWNATDGGGARVVYVRRRETGGCDAFQLMAIVGEAAPEVDTPVILALATVPGDACAAAPISADPQ